MRAFATRCDPHAKTSPSTPGWRPFDPARDWQNSDLDGPRWPKNHEALYWWRPTYWNGDPDALPGEPMEPGPADRLVERLRHEVPETQQAIERMEWLYGSAAPFAVFTHAAELAIGAYRAGTTELGDRIARVMNGGLTDKETLAEREVVLAFLVGWHAPDLQGAIDGWPTKLKLAAMAIELRWRWRHPVRYLRIRHLRQRRFVR